MVQRQRHLACGTRDGLHDRLVRARRPGLDDEVRQRRDFPAGICCLVFGNGPVLLIQLGDAQLTQVPADARLRGVDAPLPEQFNELVLPVNVLAAQDLQDRLLPLLTLLG